ncbi:hypothetical protein [Lacticaseibacillus nasuensis]|uniref:hypothetical protein n=1 Tax=Lacticaseibacillus nasuensis TaxID=944671 RepID=UPI0022459546|nr:hypothetical protein [Lacticaseibacillus nasuensis]MCX2455658.1 hypothetical protein [Lacticaseibacillus nasuensis]
MLKEIERKPVAQKIDPLASFSTVIHYPMKPQGRQAIQGYSFSLAKQQLMLSTADAKFFDSVGADRVLVMTDTKVGKIAVVPASKTEPNSFHLYKGTKSEGILPRRISVVKALAEALGEFSNLNMERFSYRLPGELVDDGAAWFLVFDVASPLRATLRKVGNN